MRRLPWILLAVVSLVALGFRHEKTSASSFDCVREVNTAYGKRRTWAAFKTQIDGPEIIACFGGLAAAEDNEKACRATLPFYGERFYCAQFQ